MIAPGSQTTLAQLGLPESFTPPKLRIPTRMFPAEKEGEWEPFKIREKRGAKSRESIDGTNLANGDVAMGEIDGSVNGDHADEEIFYEDDPTSEEGAVYPLRDGRVVDWSCFFALLTHVYNTLSPPFHTPILVISQPAWTAQDHENLTQFFFEKFKTPAFCLMDSALAVCYAYAVPTATIVDVGYTKCDVTAVREFVVSEVGRGVALPECGGEAMTQRLLKVLEPKAFNREMAEQLKKNNICEVLPPGTEPPSETQGNDSAHNPASEASTGAQGPGDGQRGSIASQGGIPRGPGLNTEVGEADQDHGDDDEGVLDVASIVASGKTSEFLAQKEREKAAKAAARKSAAAEAAAASKQARLPNSKRARAMFHYHERKPIEELGMNNGKANGDSGQHATASKDFAENTAPNVTEETEAATAAARKEERREERRRNREGTAYIRKEVEVGPERFEAANGGVLDRIADSIHRCVLSVPEISKRSELWESLIVLGNGSKVRGMQICVRVGRQN